MTVTLKARAGFDFTGKHVSTLDLGTASVPYALRASIAFADGTGADQANRIWTDRRTIAASTTEDLDLAGSALIDPFGAAVVFARVKMIAIKASPGNTNNVLVGGDSNALVGWVGNATDIVVVRPGGFFVWGAPDATAAAVTADTGDILQVANSSSGSSVTYDIVVLGCSA